MEASGRTSPNSLMAASGTNRLEKTCVMAEHHGSPSHRSRSSVVTDPKDDGWMARGSPARCGEGTSLGAS